MEDPMPIDTELKEHSDNSVFDVHNKVMDRNRILENILKEHGWERTDGTRESEWKKKYGVIKLKPDLLSIKIDEEMIYDIFFKVTFIKSNDACSEDLFNIFIPFYNEDIHLDFRSISRYAVWIHPDFLK